MSNELDDLKLMWKQSMPVADTQLPSGIVQKATAKKRSSIYFQYGNIIILAATALVIYIFLWRLYPYNYILSKAGVLVMIGSLVVRIIIEFFSIIKWRKIAVDAQALQNTENTLRYHRFRKLVHGPVTFSIVALYSLAFYSLMPEFSEHVPAWLTFVTCASYPIGAIIIIFQIKKGIRKEMDDIATLADFGRSLRGEE